VSTFTVNWGVKCTWARPALRRFMVEQLPTASPLADGPLHHGNVGVAHVSPVGSVSPLPPVCRPRRPPRGRTKESMENGSIRLGSGYRRLGRGGVLILLGWRSKT